MESMPKWVQYVMQIGADIGKISSGGNHLVQFQTQGAQQHQNGDGGDQPFDPVQNTAKNMLQPMIMLFLFFNPSLQLRVMRFFCGGTHMRVLLFVDTIIIH